MGVKVLAARKPKKTYKLILVIFVLVLLVGAGLIIVKLVFPKLVEKWGGGQISDLEKRMEELEKRQNETEQQQASASTSTGKGWLLILIILLVGGSAVGLYFLFFKGIKKASLGKTADEMIKLSLKHLLDKQGLVYLPDNLGESDIKSFNFRMFKPFRETQEAWFLFQANADAFRIGIDAASYRCFTLLMSNQNPETTIEEYPNMTINEVQKALFRRHYARKETGMPFLKSRTEEDFPGLVADIKGKALVEEIKEAYKEGYS